MTGPESPLPPWQIVAPLAATAVSRTWQVAAGGQPGVLRVDEAGASHLGLDRRAEPDVQAAAAAAGLAPAVLHADADRGLLLRAWLPGRPCSAADFADDATIGRAAALLRRLHATPLAAPVVDLSAALSRYAALAGPRFERLADTAREALAAALDPRRTGDSAALRFCHNDPTPGNFILAPDGNLTLIDWEYAGLCQPGFDLGGLAAGAGLDPERVARLLTAYLARPPTPAEVDRQRAWEAVSRALGGLWQAALAQSGPRISRL